MILHVHLSRVITSQRERERKCNIARYDVIAAAQIICLLTKAQDYLCSPEKSLNFPARCHSKLQIFSFQNMANPLTNRLYISYFLFLQSAEKGSLTRVSISLLNKSLN